MENRLATPFQQKWLSKLLGFDYEINYKKGTENKVADAFSRVTNAELLQLVVTSIHSSLYETIQESWEKDPFLQKLITEL